ncbi:hypothetical protein [Bartonella koehlerae]|uniref:Uncharacterized protein n=1 Tax=Bartonella koehlerae C-29 TaxID=1134510 RepID=A0A067W7F7_9HYPH|nr:hypothetical protein [Bartonella koehlerae]KEC55920.1 hypothetical protein O9A_00145 [Bartonella koehlerae C-29]
MEIWGYLLWRRKVACFVGGGEEICIKWTGLPRGVFDGALLMGGVIRYARKVS